MKKVLLIEDDTALRENTAELLELSGYDVHTAPDGRQGLARAKQLLPDVIVCDIMMPELDGYGVLEGLSEDTATSKIPFIFLSARTEHKEVRHGMDMGADDYLTKPFEEDELLNAIESRIAKAALLNKIYEEQVAQRDTESGMRSLHELKNFFDDNGEEIDVKRGKTLYEFGTHADYVYLVLQGVLKTHKMDESGKDLITALFKPDDFLGFTSFLDRVPHQESATAIEDARLVRIAKTQLKDVLRNSQAVTLELVELLTDNLVEIKEQLLQMAYSSVRRKTAQTIIQFSQIMNRKQEDGIKISRNDLASVAGIAPESLIRTLSTLKRDGLIEIEGRNIKILDLAGLDRVE